MAAGLLAGAITGYGYWYYVGCSTGNCPITSNSGNSTLYGLAMGGLLAATVWDWMGKNNKT